MQKACHHELRNTFRALLASPACYHTASVFDPMSARIAADLGFEVGILGGSVASLQVLAAPDVALITLSEFAEQATRIGRVARLPVIADADHGYGNALNAMRTVIELERAPAPAGPGVREYPPTVAPGALRTQRREGRSRRPCRDRLAASLDEAHLAVDLLDN